MASNEQRCAVVTGAAQGLGRAVALRLLKGNVRVVGADMQAEKIAALGRELGDSAFRPVTAEVSTEQGAAAAIDAALSAFGRIDILVNIAGGSGHVAIREIDDLPPSVWKSVVGSNLDATYLCCRAAVPHMRRAGFGRIVNFSSTLVGGSTMWPSTVGARLAYCAAKSGIDGLSRQLALDLGPANITVNVIMPEFILTEPGARVHERFNTLAPEHQQQLRAGQRGTPGDIAEAVAFLVSDGAAHINGAFLKVG